jgi:hypothetical protein
MELPSGRLIEAPSPCSTVTPIVPLPACSSFTLMRFETDRLPAVHPRYCTTDGSQRTENWSVETREIPATATGIEISVFRAFVVDGRLSVTDVAGTGDGTSTVKRLGALVTEMNSFET